jgi:hypothetical protein
MPHVDEGTLHALLDGELAPEALTEVRVHFATCASCAARLGEARQLLVETERLVNALELPGGAAGLGARVGGGAAGTRPASGGAAAGADVLRPPAPGTPLPALDPVVLIPENPTIREVRRARLRWMAWAAGFLVVVGAGYLGVLSFQSAPRSRDGQLRLSPDEFTTVPPRAEREGANADSAPTLGLSDSDVPAPDPAKAAAPAKPPAPEPERKAVAEQARTVAPAPPPAAAPAPSPAPARAAPAPAAPSRADAGQNADEPKDEAQLAKAPETAPRDTAAPPTPPEARREQPLNRSSAAQATVELDRRRTRERAAEATAALDREMAERRAAEERERQLAAQRAAAAAPRPAAAPARPAPDDRTGISSRIGLDEAARQLGGPLHAIDGLSRQMVGLVSGASVEGADPARPVVRAVYVDRSSGKMLFLDQQMAQPGDGPATPQTGSGGRQVWVKDGVLLVLHGDVGPDSLRSLARRVR